LTKRTTIKEQAVVEFVQTVLWLQQRLMMSMCCADDITKTLHEKQTDARPDDRYDMRPALPDH